MTDTSGVVARSQLTDTFGDHPDESGVLENPHLFMGREFDTESGLYFYRV
ncbi:MAG: hypothetical protein AAF530_16970 [Pseudomonadota bacterium]